MDSKKIAEILAAGAPRDETGKAVTLKEAREHKKVLGREYLEMAEGGTVSKAFAKKKDAVIAYAIDNMDNLEDWGVPAGLLQNRRESRWKIATILDEKFDDDYIISKYDDIMKMAEGGYVGLLDKNGTEIKIGSTVNVPEPNDTDVHLYEFTGTVTGFRSGNVTVEDGDGDFFEIEPERLEVEVDELAAGGKVSLVSNWDKIKKEDGIKEFKSREKRGVALVKATSWRSQQKLDAYKMVDRKNKLAIYEVPKKDLKKVLSFAGVSLIERKNRPVRFSLETGGEVKPIAPTEHYRYLDITKYPNGLELAINEEGREEVKEWQEGEMGDYEIMGELFDTVQGNSEYMWHEDLGDRGFGLTSAPGITDGYYYDDDMNLTDKGQEDSAELYSFMGYEIHSPLELLLRDGKVFFARVPKEGDVLDAKGVPVKKSRKGKKHEAGGHAGEYKGKIKNITRDTWLSEEKNGKIKHTKDENKALVFYDEDEAVAVMEMLNDTKQDAYTLIDNS